MTQIPLLTFAQAEAIGAELHDRFEEQSGSPAPLTRDDLGWADLVQFVVRRARDLATDGGEHER